MDCMSRRACGRRTWRYGERMTTKVVPVVGTFIEALAEVFTDAEHPPLGGVTPYPEHRPGADVPLDRLWGGDGIRECDAMVFVNVLRLYRSNEFPGETEEARPCRGMLHAQVQVGIARCVSTMDDMGTPPPPDVLERESLVGLDDAGRLEAAVCHALARCDDRELINQAVWTGLEPTGPEGGAMAWTCTVTVQLA